MGAPNSSSSAFSWYQECGVGGNRSGLCLRMSAAASVAARTVSVMLFRDCLCHLRGQIHIVVGLVHVALLVMQQAGMYRPIRHCSAAARVEVPRCEGHHTEFDEGANTERRPNM